MDYKILTCGILLLISLLSIRVTKKVQVPLLILFLFIGIASGSEGIGGIYFDDAKITQDIGNVALLFILFAGALETKKSDATMALYPSGILATAGVFFTAMLAALIAYVLTSLNLKESLLFGAIVSSTDAAAVISMLGGSNLKKKIRTVIEIESGSNDPMAYALILFILSMFGAGEKTSIFWGVIFLFRQIIFGALMGIIFGKISLPLGKILKIEREEFLTIHLIAMLFICFAGTNLIGGNGFLAIYLMGILVGNEHFDFRMNCIKNMRVASWLMQITMFIILGLLVFPSQLKAVVIRGSILAIMITIVARMAVVFALMSPFKYTKKEKFFMSWAGLKGAVPIIFSTNAITAGIENSQVIFNMVFYMVVFSVMIQGMTLKPLAKYLGLLDPVSEADADTIDLEELEELSLKKLYLDRKSEYINKEIRELNLPKSMHIISIRRGDEDITPRGDVILKAGDKILFSMK
ncbi:MAG: potassium/proton antiporter [Fusobacterium sp.]|jgi:cell volume regulation protein A|uniref:potassium/proton antiporter n=1 Tax=Fusobacterium sp. TaxID=68766 RepID=UPI002941D890|nr:potassium/proton antiporter [Fusobacterium sp.]MDY3060486.1 potassium/proton antiporter [Fusobacterium sp.]